MNPVRPPRLSVVVPVYNIEKYLPETIESIVSQDFDDYEAIFVDDGSPDSCPALLDAVAQKYPDKIRVIHLPQNRGTHFARKTGVLAARGDLIAFLDGDDTFLPNAFSTMIAAMENDPADILRLGVSFQVMDENIRKDLPGIDVWFNRGFAPVFESPNILKHIFVLHRAAHNVCCAIFPTPLIKKAFLAMTDLRIVAAEDLYEMFVIAHFAQSLKARDEKTYHYRLGSGVCFENISFDAIFNRLISFKNVEKSLAQFDIHPNFADFPKTFLQKEIINNVAPDWLALWRAKLKKIFADSPDSELYQFSKEYFSHWYPATDFRAEKVGNIVLFPLRKLRTSFRKLKQILREKY